MKNLFLIILCIMFYYKSSAQKITFYFKENGKKVTEQDSADFIRQITPEKENSFKVVEYYKGGKIKLEGFVTKYDPFLYFEGLVKRYFDNGTISEEVIYHKNEPLGEYKRYYRNGQLKEVEEYLENSDQSQPPYTANTRMISYFDSTGIQKVKNGSGLYENGNFDWVVKGKYSNGLKDSVWTGSNKNNDTWYRETYEQGKFLSGAATVGGQEYNYDVVEQQPEYPGGMSKFYEFVGKNYKYPADARRLGVSGRIIINFVVEKDGSLTDIKSIRDIGYGTGEEAIRVLKKSNQWNPGRQHGLPVRVSYTLPIVLGNR